MTSKIRFLYCLIFIIILLQPVIGCKNQQNNERGIKSQSTQDKTVQSTSVEKRLSPQEIALNSSSSVVLLVMENTYGHPISIGSGFFVHDKIIATNFHVIKGSSRGYAKIIGQKTKHDILGIVNIDSARDLALIEVKNEKAPILSIDDSSQVMVGDEVYVIGNPQGLEGTFSQGIVSSIRKIGQDSILQITAPFSPGSSGGPVLNSKGKVIGIAVATFKEGQNLNFAIPSFYLASLLGNMKSVKPLSTKIQNKQDKTIFNELGERTIKDVIGSHFNWEYPLSLVGVPMPNLDGTYTFSIRNKLKIAITNIYCMVVFYGSDGNPIEFDVVKYQGSIPSGLATRLKSKVDASVQKLTRKTEIKVLDFQIMD